MCVTERIFSNQGGSFKMFNFVQGQVEDPAHRGHRDWADKRSLRKGAF